MHPVPSGIMHPVSSGIMHPVSSGIIHSMSSGIAHPMSSGIMHPMLSKIMHPLPTGIMHSIPSGTVHLVPPGVMHPISSGIRHPVQSKIVPPMSSVPFAMLFPNGSVSAPTTPVAAETMRNINYQTAEHFNHQVGTHNGPLHAQCGDLERKNHNSKHRLKSEPFASLPAMDTSASRNPKHVTSAISVGVCTPASIAATPCFVSSAPAASNTFQPQLSLKDTPSIKSASQKRLFSLDVTPKRKTERRLARHIRRQQQADNFNFAGAKFSESPQAKVVPLPPFLWCEEASSSSSCSGDEQSLSSTTEVIKMEMARHGELHETPKWNKCSPSLRVMPLHCVAALPSS
uniref:Histone deacetylase complex subunit SAP130 n=1 Tax=Elaeophora elaphi TaxID=1147741 RepID=A0A0R3S2H1_9BILA